ncbi:carboxypeptidase-like regulatory domain-containing protein [Fluviicola sp.]|jgi:hypothetical protein|uniref:TonB-dependent receptor n=1 Tax=Fluviicola sp. TaxID=1917219 RepID=UPI00282EEC14|nr:carboxypeptidase-like regulatory domain-containing protein [Fluviicola sp.]MDR0800936.1 TonB-dependent receptor [Fluviicola sp.]
MKYFFFGFFLFVISFSHAQLQGIVFGIKNERKIPLKQAKVILRKAQTQVYTDEKGRFEIILSKELPDVLVVFAQGYESDSVMVTKSDRYTGMEIDLFESDELDEVVVEFKQDSKTFSRLKPLQVENLGEGELKKAACCNLSESFETNATVDVSFTDAVSGAKKIQLLGLDGVYTQLQMENIPFLTGLESSFGLNSVPGTWVESIQITKGTGSVVNGYESMAGLINVEFRKPKTMQRLFVNGYGNMLGRAELNVHGGQIINDKWSTGTFAHVSALQSEWDINRDGFRDAPLSKSGSFMNRWEYNGKKFETRFGINAYYDQRQGGQLYGTTIRYKAETTNQHAEFFAKTGFLFPNKPYQSFGVVYQFKYHESDGLYGLRNFGGRELRGYINAIFDGIIGTTAHKYKMGLSVVGQDLQQQLDSANFNRNVITPGAFFEYTYTGTRLTLVAGMRADYQTAFSDQKEKFQFSPRVHAKYALDEYTDIRITTGKAWRLPTVVMDNSSLLATSRTWVVSSSNEQEEVWNSGISVIRSMRWWNRATSISVDFYYARFNKQLIIDRERSTDSIFFGFQSNVSRSSTFQSELSFMPWRTITFRLAYKYLEVKASYAGSLRQQVMIPPHRVLFNVAFASRNKKWEIDGTVSVYSPMRLPDVTMPDGTHLTNEKSQVVPVGLAQVTRHFKHWDLYVGGENLFNFRQKNPIVSANNPYDPTFDATRVWASVMGTVVYAGFRYEIKRKTEKK